MDDLPAPILEASESLNSKWKIFHGNQTITVPRKALFSRSDRFFTIGSCFAEEVRKALLSFDVTCLPEYKNITVDRNRYVIDTLPEREHMNYYNTYSIRQEFERAAGLWSQGADDIWVVPERELHPAGVIKGSGTVYQDPYRRLVFGKSRSDLLEAIEQINVVFRQGLMDASVVVMTLGMTEVFFDRKSKRVVNQIPAYGRGAGKKETRFHASSLGDNIENLERTIAILEEINPGCKIVMTVSPVPLSRTFSGEDVFTANFHSKAILLAAAREVCSRHAHCHYFPSFEFTNLIGKDAYLEKDGRHVKAEVVRQIMSAFIKATFD